MEESKGGDHDRHDKDVVIWDAHVQQDALTAEQSLEVLLQANQCAHLKAQRVALVSLFRTARERPESLSPLTVIEITRALHGLPLPHHVEEWQVGVATIARLCASPVHVAVAKEGGCTDLMEEASKSEDPRLCFSALQAMSLIFHVGHQSGTGILVPQEQVQPAVDAEQEGHSGEPRENPVRTP